MHNFHNKFIHLASQFRCHVYDIQPVDELTSKRIAGNIIPAISTSTAFVAAAVTLELIKIGMYRSQLKKESLRLMKPPAKSYLLSQFRNSYTDLGEAQYTYAQPMQAFSDRYPKTSEEYNIWDTIQFDESISELTIEDVEAKLQQQYGIKLNALFLEDELIYDAADSSISKQETILSLLKTNFTKNPKCAHLSFEDWKHQQLFVDLMIDAQDESVEDVIRLPPLRIDLL